MIPTKSIKNVKVAAPILNLLVTNPYVEKAYIKTLYPQWKGETLSELREGGTSGLIRIGTPNTDNNMRSDRLYFIQSYLSFNPVTKDVEKRELIPYRNVEKVYFGPQSLEEKSFNNYSAFVNGTIVAKDLILMDEKSSLKDIIKKLQQNIDILTKEVLNLKAQLQKQNIYKQ
jgi:hypothetical protein